MTTLRMAIFCTTLAGAAFGWGGCENPSFLEQRTKPDRAAFGTEVIDLRTLPRAIAATIPAPPTTAPAELGNWTYTVPSTVTSVEHKTASAIEVSLFMGRPGPGDLPFMVITTTHDRQTRAVRDPSFTVQEDREYTMNGSIVKEWTGLTATGAGFSELLVRRPGPSGDSTQVCHAIALARTEDEQKLALSILGSITWTPARP